MWKADVMATLRSTRTRGFAGFLASGLLIASLAACSGDDTETVSADKSPEEVLTLAKSQLDETSGVKVTLSTDDLPEGVTGITKAEGVGTTDPLAFEGSITVVLLGNSVNVPVIGADGKVYAIIPLTSGYQEVDPGEYGAPDPAQLLSSDAGLSSLLTETTDVEEGESIRGGDNNSEVLTEYSGSLPESAAKNVIPSAEGDFEATYSITAEGELREAVITGNFYGDAGPLTYTVDFDDYGTEQDIVAP